MANISETIPDTLAAPAEAARAWYSNQQHSQFKITGIVDADESQADSPQVDLQLILCGADAGSDLCLKEQFTVRQEAGTYQVTHVTADPPAIGSPAPLLDPPAGVRQGWLDEVLGQHSFVLLLFYRGLW